MVTLSDCVFQIAETYAFLPREAVTRFLMSCADCQKRMHLSLETNNNQPQDAAVVASQDPPIIDFSVPITTTYLNHLRSKRGATAVSGETSGEAYIDDNYFNSTLDREVSEPCPAPWLSCICDTKCWIALHGWLGQG